MLVLTYSLLVEIFFIHTLLKYFNSYEYSPIERKFASSQELKSKEDFFEATFDEEDIFNGSSFSFDQIDLETS